MNILDDSNYKKSLDTDKQSLVLFWAPWCKYCSSIKAYLPKLKNDNLNIFSCNIEEAPEFASMNDLMSLPTVLIFANTKLIKKIIGNKTFEEMVSEIEGK